MSLEDIRVGKLCQNIFIFTDPDCNAGCPFSQRYFIVSVLKSVGKIRRTIRITCFTWITYGNCIDEIKWGSNLLCFAESIWFDSMCKNALFLRLKSYHFYCLSLKKPKIHPWILSQNHFIESFHGNIVFFLHLSAIAIWKKNTNRRLSLSRRHWHWFNIERIT